MSVDRLLKEEQYKQLHSKAARKDKIRKLTRKVCDRNDGALRRLSKS